MKAVSRPYAKGSQAVLKGSIPFKKGLVTSLHVSMVPSFRLHDVMVLLELAKFYLLTTFNNP